MKARTGGQAGPSHGLSPRKEMAGATHIHTLKRLKMRGATNSSNLGNFCFCNINCLRSYKIILFYT